MRQILTRSTQMLASLPESILDSNLVGNVARVLVISR